MLCLNTPTCQLSLTNRGSYLRSDVVKIGACVQSAFRTSAELVLTAKQEGARVLQAIQSLSGSYPECCRMLYGTLGAVLGFFR